MSEADKKAAARAAYGEGVQLQDQGKPAEALVKFETAQKMYDAPTHQLHIAECQALLGKLVESSETYETLQRLSLPAGSPEAFVQAQDQAKAEAPALRARIPTLKITIKPDPKSLQNLVINVNDKTMPAELIGIARPVNPGPYRLSATANGYATKAPVEFALNEKEGAVKELVLEPGSGGAVVVAAPPPYGANGQQPQGATDPNKDKPPEQPKKEEGPPTTGLLFGAHGGLFVPSGNAGKDSAGDVKMDNVASSGGGLGIDFMARFAKIFLVGLRGEAIFLGGPDAKNVPTGQTLTSTQRMFGAALLVGLLTSSEHVGFYTDLGFGYRAFSVDRTLATGSTSVETTRDLNGTYFSLGVGVSIPAGPIRIVPKVGFDFGGLADSSGATATTTTNPVNTSTVQNQSAGYQLFFVGLAVFYSYDLGKKPGVSASL